MKSSLFIISVLIGLSSFSQDSYYIKENFKKVTISDTNEYQLLTENIYLFKDKISSDSVVIFFPSKKYPINLFGFYQSDSIDFNIAFKLKHVKKSTYFIEVYYSDGSLKSKFTKSNGEYDGEYIRYYRNGIVNSKLLYSKGRVVKETYQDENGHPFEFKENIYPKNE